MNIDNPKLRTIRLYGKLGARFGRVHLLAVNSAGEAIRALCFQLRGFERELMTSNDRGISYAVFLGKKNITADRLGAMPGESDIRVAPIIQGAKSGIFSVILGAALVVASFYTGGLATAGYLSATAAAGLGSAAFGLGVSLALGGISQMLTKTASGLSTSDSTKASYAFNGAVNTTVQGNPVPLLYGRMRVGSAVISAGIYADDQT